MTRLPRISGKKMVKALEKVEFEVIRIKGSHYFLRHNDGRCTVIPVHRNEILGPGITSQILRDCELTVEDFEKLL